MKLKQTLSSIRTRWSALFDRFGVYLPGAIAVGMIVLFYLPDKSFTLQFDRMEILSGQFWRFYTYAFTHWDMNHFMWDVLSFAIIGYLCWEKSRKVFCWIMVMAPLAVSLSLWLFFIDLYAFRGIGGVTSALVAAVAVFYLRDTSRRMNIMGLTMILAILGKLMIELHSGQSLLAKYNELPAIVMVYIAGATVGLLITTLSLLRKQTQDTCHGK